MRFSALCALLGVVAAVAAGAADSAPSRRDAEQMRLKMAAIEKQAAVPSRQVRRTPLTQDEVNAYLAIDGREFLPAGVAEPAVAILGTGRLSARVTVDLDAVRRQKNPSSMLDPSSYLTGRVPLTATGMLVTARGVGRFQLESASVAGVPIPKPILQELLSRYLRTPEHPDGLALDDPFPLPARIQTIEVEPGRAIIVQ